MIFTRENADFLESLLESRFMKRRAVNLVSLKFPLPNP